MARLGAIFDAPGRLSLAARRPGALVEVAFWRDAAAAGEALAARLGSEMPRSGQVAVVSETGCILRIAPQRYWCCDDEPSPLFETIASQVADSVGSVSDLSHARMVADVAGLDAESLLARLVPIDLRTAAFPVGAFAQTFVQDANLLLRRTGDDTFAILLPTSFADSLADSLCHTAALMYRNADGDTP